MPKIKVDATSGLNQFTGSGYVLTPATITAQAAGPANSANTLTQAALTIVSSGDVNHRVYLPSPTECDLGQVIRLASGATAFELSSKGDGTTKTTINGTDVTALDGTYAAELLVPAHTLMTCVKTGANAWLCGDPDAGTPD